MRIYIKQQKFTMINFIFYEEIFLQTIPLPLSDIIYNFIIIS